MDKSYNLVEAIKNAKSKKDRGIFFICNHKEDKFVTYEQLYNNAIKTLYYLQKRGIKSGNELVIQIANEEQLLVVFWASILGGIIPVPVAKIQGDENKVKVIKMWSYLNNPHIIANEDSINKIQSYVNINNVNLDYSIKSNSINVEEIFDSNNNVMVKEMAEPVEVENDSIAFIQFSSGSTGNPKGVTLTHENLIINCKAIIKGMKVTEDDAFFSWLPLSHDMGMIGFSMTPIVLGINQCIMTTNKFIRDPFSWFEKALQCKATILCSPNFGYKYFLSKFDESRAKNLDLSKIRLIVNGAEAISYTLCNKFLNAMKKYNLKEETLFTVYGMAEASVAVAFPPVNERFQIVFINRNKISLGKKIEIVDEKDENAVGFVKEGYAIDNCYLQIGNELGEELEEEYIGEIQIRGKNVTKGYYNNEAATQNSLTPQGWLRTGDIGFIKDGQLVFTGRTKEIIVINGKNYYPYDIEKNICELGEVVAVGELNKEKESEEIIIFVRCSKNKDINLLAPKIKENLRTKMGLFVSDVVAVKKIPKTTSGKIQRYKLLEMYHEMKDRKYLNESISKSGDLNVTTKNLQVIIESLISSCKAILQKNNLTADENIYESGMDSLKMSLLIQEIQESFNVDISYDEMFKLSTLNEVASYILNCNSSSSEFCIDYKSCAIDNDGQYYQSSAAQKRIYVAAQMEEKSIAYNMPEAILIEGDINPIKVNKAFKTIIDRHEILRTSFELVDEQLVQIIHDKVDFEIDYYYATMDEVNSVIDKFIKPFNLLKAPLMRVALIKSEGNKTILVIDMHHIISDGWSVAVLLQELFTIIEEKQLPEIKLQFKDFARWQNIMLKSENMETKKQYWINKLIDKNKEEVSVLNFPTDFKRPAKKSFNGGRIAILANKDIISKLNGVAMSNFTTLHMVTLTAYYILLSKYSGQDDIIIGSPIAGRQKNQFYNLIGMFVNMIVNRNTVKNTMTFKELLLNVKHSCIEAYENQEYQFDELVRNLNIKRDLSRSPIFDYAFAYQNFDFFSIVKKSHKISSYEFDYKISRFDMFLSIMDVGDRVKFMLEYSKDLFKKSTAEKVLDHYFEILNQIIDNPEIRIEDIHLTNNLNVASNKILEEDISDFIFN